jgi:hypothetical protein
MPESLANLWQEFRTGLIDLVAFLPYLILALAILVLGWYLATLVRKLVIVALLSLLAKKSDDQLRIMGLGAQERTKNVELVGSLFFWSIIFLILILFLNVLGLQIGANVAARLLEIVPSIFIASLILILGMVFAVFVEQVSRIVLQNVKSEHFIIWSKILKWITVGFVILLALDQLGIAARVVVSLFLIVVGAAAFTLALAFGLGCKEIARDIVIEFFKKEERPE